VSLCRIISTSMTMGVTVTRVLSFAASERYVVMVCFCRKGALDSPIQPNSCALSAVPYDDTSETNASLKRSQIISCQQQRVLATGTNSVILAFLYPFPRTRL